ncbi:MAG: S-methyl-5'-thioadenosine phosphorylase [Phycisphaerales bacterium]
MGHHTGSDQMPNEPHQLRIGIIGGSGLGRALTSGFEDDVTDFVEHDLTTPFGKPSAPIITAQYRDVPIAVLPRHGIGHTLLPAKVPYRANIFALKSLGCTHIIASGATGSLREEIEPGDLVLVDQLIDRTDGRPRTFYENAAVHVEFAEPVCPLMQHWLQEAAKRLEDVTVHDRGVYICMEGPSFSTRAESMLHRQWGGDLIGMTALPEARLAREAEMAYALIALPTDYDCWRERPESQTQMSLIEEIISNLNTAVANSIALIQTALDDVSSLREQPSPAHDALALAIWTDKSLISCDEVKRLEPLWGRHFMQAAK